MKKRVPVLPAEISPAGQHPCFHLKKKKLRRKISRRCKERLGMSGAAAAGCH